MTDYNHTTAYKKTSKGFTLIEVLVSLSIFTIVVTISISTLLVLIDANAKSQAMQVVMSNLSFALDSMTREIRTGESYYCIVNTADFDLTLQGTATKNCTSGSSAFSFNEGDSSVTGSYGSRRIGYRLNSTNNSIERRLGDQNFADEREWVRVTSPDVTVDDLDFIVTGTSRLDTITPTVTIYVSGPAGTGAGRSTFEIETTGAQILLDV